MTKIRKITIAAGVTTCICIGAGLAVFIAGTNDKKAMILAEIEKLEAEERAAGTWDMSDVMMKAMVLNATPEMIENAASYADEIDTTYTAVKEKLDAEMTAPTETAAQRTLREVEENERATADRLHESNVRMAVRMGLTADEISEIVVQHEDRTESLRDTYEQVKSELALDVASESEITPVERLKRNAARDKAINDRIFGNVGSALENN